ncbi:hydrogenase maturation protease [Clostridium aminobutyricum]|uniref:Hydrogenase maturation protease n=1 Tax=Clostridium aminobutyricum TaxID=33953 RepID=A0A939DA71_CLOAM|nr:hydrogenase maturation protease [Clostridium aminobutyricum]MBN7773970.1 hydrogenase maturation protease [Clostridium aminobutyricum]
MMKVGAIGNRFMRDDGIAIKILECIKGNFKDYDLDIIIGETDSQGFFYLLNEGDFVILLDAQSIGTEPGEIHVYRLEEALAQPSECSMHHDLSIIELMKLYHKTFKGYIIGIEVAEIDLSDELSPFLQEKFSFLCSEIENLIKNMILEELNHA